MQISFNTTGVERIRELLVRMDVNMQFLQDPLRLIANDVLATEKRIFSTEGSFQGRPKWPGLSDSYLDWKDVMYPGQKILHLEGPLKTSLITRGTGHIEKHTRDSLEIGTSDRKAIYHQFGTRKMPPRPPLTVNKQQRKRWIKIVVKHLLEITD